MSNNNQNSNDSMAAINCHTPVRLKQIKGLAS